MRFPKETFLDQWIRRDAPTPLARYSPNILVYCLVYDFLTIYGKIILFTIT